MISGRTTWLFDLDNTLHNANAHIFPRIHQLMMDYICRELGVGEERAIALRRRYLRRYGATLLGMMVSALLPTSLTKPLLRREHGGQVVGWARRQGRSAS